MLMVPELGSICRTMPPIVERQPLVLGRVTYSAPPFQPGRRVDLCTHVRWRSVPPPHSDLPLSFANSA